MDLNGVRSCGERHSRRNRPGTVALDRAGAGCRWVIATGEASVQAGGGDVVDKDKDIDYRRGVLPRRIADSTVRFHVHDAVGRDSDGSFHPGEQMSSTNGQEMAAGAVARDRVLTGGAACRAGSPVGPLSPTGPLSPAGPWSPAGPLSPAGP